MPSLVAVAWFLPRRPRIYQHTLAGMCVATCNGNMFIVLCKAHNLYKYYIYINITRNSHTLFILFIHLYLATCFAHIYQTTADINKSITTSNTWQGKQTNKILCYSHCAYSCNQYINQRMILITYNWWQLSKCYMFRHEGAIRRKSFRSKEYKRNILRQVLRRPPRND